MPAVAVCDEPPAMPASGRSDVPERNSRGEEHIALQREIVSRPEHLREPVTLQTARELLRNMEHAQVQHVTERDRLREFLGH